MKIKLITIALLLLCIIASSVSAIDGEGEESQSHHVSARVPRVEDDTSCHWGLKHWFMGIYEYTARCLCCGVPKRDDRAYITKGHGSSDCCAVSLTYRECDNPCCGALCCPAVAACHVLSLPLALCYRSPHQSDSIDMSLEGCIRDGVELSRDPPPVHHHTAAASEESTDDGEKEKLRRQAQERNEEERRRAQLQDVRSYVDWQNGH